MDALGLTKRFVLDDRGMELVEYAVMATLVVGGTVVAIGALIVAIIGHTQDLAALISGG